MTLHPEVLARGQRRALQQMGPELARRRFYLGGGTAVALHLGHRRSVDLDWFTQERIPDPLGLAQELRGAGIPVELGTVDAGTLHGSVLKVRVSFLEYRYALLEPAAAWPEAGCLLASLDDLACMKLSAIVQHGSKRDFIDLYALGERHRPLEQLAALYQRRYGVRDVGHVLRAAVYFDDAERERMPRMLWPATWRGVKQTVRGWVREVAG